MEFNFDNYRFKEYLNLNNRKLVFIEKRFWKFLSLAVIKKKPINVYKKLKYLGSGWEWSVFLDKNKAIKIPSGVFSEVNDQEYLNNSKQAYEIIQKYIPKKFVAETSFYRKNELNIIDQEYIEGKANFVIGYHTKNKRLLNNLEKFLESSLVLLEKQKWLPDLDIHRKQGGFALNNVIFNKYNCPKIVDFTAYYDVFRLYPYRQKIEIKLKSKKIKDLLKWVKTKKNNL